MTNNSCKTDQKSMTKKAARKTTGKEATHQDSASRAKDLWNRHFEELQDFFKNHGHSDVPCPYPTNERLSRWVKRQRWAYALLYKNKDTVGKKSTANRRPIREDQIARLQTVNFTWNLHERTWEKAYNSLLEFKAKHGHTNVPGDYEDAHLAQWVRHQRLQIRKYFDGYPSSSTGSNKKTKKTHSITLERLKRLYDVGFSCYSARPQKNGTKLWKSPRRFHKPPCLYSKKSRRSKDQSMCLPVVSIRAM